MRRLCSWSEPARGNTRCELDRAAAILGRLAVTLVVAASLVGCGYDQVVQSWFTRPDLAVPPGTKLPGHVYLIRGLVGDIYSLGMDQLAGKVAHRGVTATVHGLSEYIGVSNDIIRRYKAGEERGPIMLIGHSSGGDLIISMAQRLKEADVPVALAFGFDPTRLAGAVPANVALFINLYQRLNPIGGGEVTAGPGFRGRLIDVDLREHSEIVHINLDKTPVIQDLVADKIVAVAVYAARAAKTPSGKLPDPAADLLPLVLKYVVPRDAPIELWDTAIRVKTKPGDTLQSVAATYGAPAWAIAQINGLRGDQAIEPGRSLLIPRNFYTAPQAMPAALARMPAPPPAAAGKPPVHDEQQRNDQANTATPREVEQPSAETSSSFSERWHAETAQ